MTDLTPTTTPPVAPEDELLEPQMIIEQLKTLFQTNEARSLLPFLPLFNIHGNPMTLDNHFVMEPLFKLQQPKRLVLMCGRQVGKSLSLAAQSILHAAILPHFHTIFVQPRHDQIEYFADTYINAMINCYQEQLLDPARKNTILQKSFYNNSDMYFTYAFLDAERVRGKSYIAKAVFDEMADIYPDAPEIVGECMSAHLEYGFYIFSGTPKTTDNPLTVKWEESSQAEWLLKCKKCNYENIPNLKNDLLKMIGKVTCCCAKCGRALNVADGFYMHNKPKLRNSYAGYHIPQVVHPIHANYPNKWQDLLQKQATWKTSKFSNEVLGEATDDSVCPITEADIRAASNGGKNNMSDAIEQRKKYDAVVMGVDWSGFGAENVSTTACAILGARPGTDVLDTLYLERFNTKGASPEEEARRLIDISHNFHTTYFAHDFTGAGMIRESMMVQKGYPVAQVIPFQLVHAPANKNIITYYAPAGTARECWNIDKTRSLMILFEMIKRKKVTVPTWESSKELLSDLLAIVQETRETPRGSEFTIMFKKPKVTDDICHAINFACSAIWHIRHQYPSMAENILPDKGHVTKEEFELMDPGTARWNER